MKKTTIYIACLLVLVSTGCDKTVLEFPENGGVDPTLVNANLTLAIDPKIEPYEPTERSKASEADLHDVRWIVEVFRDEIGGECSAASRRRTDTIRSAPRWRCMPPDTTSWHGWTMWTTVRRPTNTTM